MLMPTDYCTLAPQSLHSASRCARAEESHYKSNLDSWYNTVFVDTLAEIIKEAFTLVEYLMLDMTQITSPLNRSNERALFELVDDTKYG